MINGGGFVEGVASSTTNSKKIIEIISFFLILVICICFLAIYSASETALNSINLIRFNTILEQQKRRKLSQNSKLRRKIIKSMKIRLLIKEYMITISSIAIVSNIIMITASTISIAFFQLFINSTAKVDYISWAVLTVAIIIFGEILPKFFGRNWPEKTVIALFYFYYYAYWLFAPLLKGVDKILTIKKRSFVTRDELAVIIHKMYQEGMISKSEKRITANILTFERKSVENIYIQKRQIIFMYQHELQQAKINFIYKIYMKELIPILERDTGKFIAFLNYKKYLKILLTYSPEDVSQAVIIDKCLDPPCVIRSTTSLAEAYSKISKVKNHLVAVVDNYVDRKFLGLLDAKLILASIISKQFAVAPENENFLYQQISSEVFLVNSRCDTRMVFNHIINLPEIQTKYRTIDKFLIHLNQGIVRKYESVFFRNYEFKKFTTGKGNSFYEVTRNEIIVKKTVL